MRSFGGGWFHKSLFKISSDPTQAPPSWLPYFFPLTNKPSYSLVFCQWFLQWPLSCFYQDLHCFSECPCWFPCKWSQYFSGKRFSAVCFMTTFSYTEYFQVRSLEYGVATMMHFSPSDISAIGAEHLVECGEGGQ